MSTRFLVGDVRETLKQLPDACVQCVVTSPAYFGLRDYGMEGQMGLEKSPDEYVAELVGVFREVRRVLRGDGTVWLNIGDSYNAYNGNRGDSKSINKRLNDEVPRLSPGFGLSTKDLKNKDRMMIPARTAIALQADGWWLRDEIVWHKPRTTPFPANDRTVAAHEMVYLLTKQARYFFDWAAIEEPAAYAGLVRKRGAAFRLHGSAKTVALTGATHDEVGNSRGQEVTVRDTRRKRSVWSISPSPYKDAHFATMPVDLAEICVKAGSRIGDTVLDPFGGAGTTALAAQNLGRSAVLCELNPAYVRIAKRRLGVSLDILEYLAEMSEAVQRANRAWGGSGT